MTTANTSSTAEQGTTSTPASAAKSPWMADLITCARFGKAVILRLKRLSLRWKRRKKNSTTTTTTVATSLDGSRRPTIVYEQLKSHGGPRISFQGNRVKLEYPSGNEYSLKRLDGTWRFEDAYEKMPSDMDTPAALDAIEVLYSKYLNEMMLIDEH